MLFKLTRDADGGVTADIYMTSDERKDRMEPLAEPWNCKASITLGKDQDLEDLSIQDKDGLCVGKGRAVQVRDWNFLIIGPTDSTTYIKLEVLERGIQSTSG